MTRTQLLVSLAGTIALAIPSAAMAQVGPDPNSPPPEGYYAPPPVGYGQPYQPPPPQPYQPQPSYPQPAPVYQPQPNYPQPVYQPAPVYQPEHHQPALPVGRRSLVYGDRFRAQFGLAARFGGYGNYGSFGSYNTGGGGLDLLFRVHPRITLEMGFQYQRISQEDLYWNEFQYERFDVPMTIGMRVHLGNPMRMFSPYLVGAGGITYSRLYQFDSLVYESHLFGEVQGGVGFEWRLGPHFAFNFDVRGQTRFRKVGELGTPDSTEGTLTDQYGNTVPAMGPSVGFLINLGIGGFF